MSMEIVNGDLIALALDGRYDAIAHGCNCQCTMGAGIAKHIAEFFPEAARSDRQTEKGDTRKLGGFSCQQCTTDNSPVWVFNLYTQYDFWGPQPRCKLEHVHSALLRMKRYLEKAHIDAPIRIGLPLIGCGLGGQQEEDVLGIVSEVFANDPNFHVEIVVYSRS